MNIAIDTSAIIAVITNEAQKSVLIEQTKNMTLIAPFSIEWEIGNAFSAMLKRNRINVEQAINAVSIYKQIAIRLVEIELDEAIKLAGKLDIYAYDAYLIRCAIKYQCPLITLDRGLKDAAKRADVEIIEV